MQTAPFPLCVAARKQMWPSTHNMGLCEATSCERHYRARCCHIPNIFTHSNGQSIGAHTKWLKNIY